MGLVLSFMTKRVAVELNKRYNQTPIISIFSSSRYQKAFDSGIAGWCRLKTTTSFYNIKLFWRLKPFLILSRVEGGEIYWVLFVCLLLFFFLPVSIILSDITDNWLH